MVVNDLELAQGEARVALEMRATPIVSEEGTITHALVVFQDITARREAEQVLADYNRHLEQQVQQRTQTLEQEILERQQVTQALRQSEATQRAILRAIPDLLLRVRGDGTYLARLNGSEVAILSGNQDISGKTVDQMMPPDLAEKRMHVIRRALRTGDMQIYEQQVELNGAMRDEETRTVKTGDDEVLVIVRDISDRKQAERALQQSENRNRAILMAIPDLMFHVNREGIDRLEYLAQTDGLTQLANRRHFDHWLAQSWQEMERIHQPLALLIFDVDQFKRYNDYYGHLSGDRCLTQIAQAARQVIRYPADLVARYGGEEFAIILPNVTIRGAVQVAERLHRAIHTLAIPHACSIVGPTVTVSIGISILTPNSETSFQDLISQADHALYLAKEQGRDRYILSAPPIETV